MALLEQVQQIVADKLSVDESEVVPEASFTEDLNADSLDLVELIMAFEEEFSSGDVQIEISDEEAESITTVQAAIDYLRDKGIEDCASARFLFVEFTTAPRRSYCVLLGSKSACYQDECGDLGKFPSTNIIRLCFESGLIFIWLITQSGRWRKL